MVEAGRQSSDLLEFFSLLRFKEDSPRQTESNTHPQPWCGKHVNDADSNPKNFYNYAANLGNEKTPMCQIAELARHHKLKHEYVLMDESGPAHKKKFSVKLVLKDGEEYEGSGASIKKAQQSAAENALEKTKLAKPPKKTHKSKNDNNPVWLLFNVAHQFGVEVRLNHEQLLKSKSSINYGEATTVPRRFNNMPNCYVNPIVSSWHPLKSGPPGHIPCSRIDLPYMYWLPHSSDYAPQSQSRLNNSKNGRTKNSELYHRCTFSLSDGSAHSGSGKTLGFAKNEAAIKALFHLRPLLSEQEAKIRRDDSMFVEQEDNKSDSSSCESDSETNDVVDNKENDVIQQRKKSKSVVSEIHEAAFRLKMNVELELLNQSGEPHNRSYTMRCRLTSPKSSRTIEADGSGSSKKSAKQCACKQLLEKVSCLENDPVYLASLIVKSSVNKKAINKETKRKTIVKDMKMNPQYGHHINPISRLIQVMQARKERDPIFKFIGENGQNRYREFVVEVKCMNMIQTGVGQNKKLAKRAAAEAMLSAIGYVKPMPQPGKSLLKKRSCDDMKPVMTEIGVFDASELENISSIPARDSEDVSPSGKGIEGAEGSTTKETQLKQKDDAFNPIQRVRAESENLPSDLAPVRLQKRRVTFSTKVAECPPPEDSNYPTSSVALLKSEVVVAPKLKKRGRDSKKALSNSEKISVASICQLFLTYPQCENTRCGFVQRDNPVFDVTGLSSKDKSNILLKSNFFDMNLYERSLNPQPASSETTSVSSQSAVGQSLGDNYDGSGIIIRNSKWLLETLAKIYKFTVSYSDFPKATDAENFFSIVTVGLDKPILLPGTGADEDSAHLDAAYHGIEVLAQLDKGN